jgi:hypothetical protein
MGFMRFGIGRDAADVAFATMFGSVQAGPPVIDIRAVEGPGLEMPVHCTDALSTATVLAPSSSDCASFGARSPERAPGYTNVQLVK